MKSFVLSRDRLFFSFTRIVFLSFLFQVLWRRIVDKKLEEWIFFIQYTVFDGDEEKNTIFLVALQQQQQQRSQKENKRN